MKIIPSKNINPIELNSEPHIKNDHIVLMAEDDLDDQEILVEAIKKQDSSFEFIIANTGSKALEMLFNLPESKKPSLILLDYNLPEFSGADILMKLREMKRYDDVVKVVWSTSNSPVYEKKSLELGAFEYIVKPTGVEQIRDIARKIIELSRKSVVSE